MRYILGMSTQEDFGLFDPSEPHVKGTVLVRHYGSSSLHDETHQRGGPKDGKKIVMLIGLVSVPEDFQLKDDHMHVVVGDAKGLSLTFLADGAEKLGRPYKNYRADQLLTAPIWRV